jgi:hypothetical protein
MSQLINRLDALKVRRTEKAGYYADGAGLYLQVSGGGARSWIFRFTMDGRTRDMGLGSVVTFSLAEARQAAIEARKLQAAGIDPIEHRNAQRGQERAREVKAATFRQEAEAYIDAHRSVLTIHSVRATKIVLDMIEAHLPPARGRVVLHWFTGTASEIRRAVDLGCYFSVNAEMLANTKRSKVNRAFPLNRVVTETDGPFTRTGDRPSQPTDVHHAVEGLAALHDLAAADIGRQIVDNLRALLATG